MFHRADEPLRDAQRGVLGADDRVLEILIVASHYDAFVLEEDGQLTELVIEECRNLDLNLRYAPRFTRAADAASAFAILGGAVQAIILVEDVGVARRGSPVEGRSGFLGHPVAPSLRQGLGEF